MLKVLIADDEPYVREGIKNIVPWNECGYEVCGEGVNGDDTYEKVMKLNPDLVLIDIRMPGKLGLEVIKESIEHGFKGRFVIISGYSDFRYAKEAISYGVKSYILKPIDEDELIEIVVSLRKEIIEEREKLNKLEQQKIFVKEYSLTQFLLGKSVDNFEELINSLKASSYTVALVSGDYNRNHVENIIELENLIRRKISAVEGVEVCKVKNKVAILFSDVSESHYLNIINNVKKEIKKEKREVFITIGSKVNSLEEILKSYKKANELMKHKFLFLEEEIISMETVEEINKKKKILDENEIINRIHSYVEIGEVNKIKTLITSLKETIKGNLYTEEHVKIFITKSCLEFNEKIKNDYEIGKESIVDNEKAIEEVYSKDSLVEIMDFLYKRFAEISKIISFNTSDKSIKRIVMYIDKNYYTDLKLELLAEIFNYNSAYLGKVFKSHTGVSFNTYLDTIRIDHAKKFLVEDGIKVYQVCERVGYKNIDYFHSKFKKYVGVSPLNYKKQVDEEARCIKV